jgi:hypothetical protein
VLSNVVVFGFFSPVPNRALSLTHQSLGYSREEP